MGLGRRGEAAEHLDDGDDEGEGLAGAGGGVDGHVLVRQQQRDGRRLHRRAPPEAAAVQGLDHLRGQGRGELREPLLRQRALPGRGRRRRGGGGGGHGERCVAAVGDESGDGSRV